MRVFEVNNVLQTRDVVRNVEVEHLFVALRKNLSVDLVSHRHHEGVLVDEKERFLGGRVLSGSLKGAHVWVEIEFDILRAGEDLVEDCVGGFLCD